MKHGPWLLGSFCCAFLGALAACGDDDDDDRCDCALFDPSCPDSPVPYSCEEKKDASPKGAPADAGAEGAAP